TLWIFGTEYGNFLAGLMGAAEIAAESVVFQLNQLGYLIPIGIGSALIARIGFYLGSQQAEKAIRVVATSLTFMACIGAFVGTVCEDLLPGAAAAEAIYISLAPYLSFYTAFQLAAYPSIAALRACSYHMHLLFMNFIAYYIVSMPLGVSLAFAAGWQLSGLWLGFVLGSFTFFALPSLYLLRLDWRQKALDAHANAEMETDMELLNERQPLMLAAAATSAATAGNLHPAGASAMASYQLSASVSQRQRNAVRSKLPVLAAAVALLIGSLFLRLLLPPRGPTAPAGHPWKRDGLHYSGAGAGGPDNHHGDGVRDGHEAVDELRAAMAYQPSPTQYPQARAEAMQWLPISSDS
uniref:MFS domain-containing protein n=1 Tax=Macrostomum lignano TaxID=282301 RepID=A0A1I8F6K3_9PLAT